jgi:hypothetical protein
MLVHVHTNALSLILPLFNCIIIIVVVGLITRFGIYLLRNLYLPQFVSGIRLGQGKEIHPIPFIIFIRDFLRLCPVLSSSQSKPTGFEP